LVVRRGVLVWWRRTGLLVVLEYVGFVGIFSEPGWAFAREIATDLGGLYSAFVIFSTSAATCRESRESGWVFCLDY
jgi:hypothetical protein